MTSNTSRIPGHKRPFGSHMKPMGVTVIGKFSSPVVFFGHFVRTKKPIHMKSALIEANHPGMTEWTDEFFRNYFGVNMVRVEVGKKEMRGRKAKWMRFRDYLEAYTHNDLYLVHSITGLMKNLVHVPATLQCGGFQKALQEAVIWMGRGPLQSVLHYDELDNLLCVFDGTKDIVLIDEFYRDKVEARGFDQEGHYSNVDMESVDMHSFPQFENLPWYRVHMEAGDCVYIPYRWYHQVSTFGDRSVAINIWFSHLWRFDDDDCLNFESAPTLRPLDDFGFVSANEAVRSRWLETFEGSDDDVDSEGFISRVSTGSKEHKEKVFKMVDKDQDGLLSWDELYTFDITRTLLLYPEVFQESKKVQSHIETDKAVDTIMSEPIQKTEEGEKHLWKCSEREKEDGECTTGTEHSEKEETTKLNSQHQITGHEEL